MNISHDSHDFRDSRDLSDYSELEKFRELNGIIGGQDAAFKNVIVNQQYFLNYVNNSKYIETIEIDSKIPERNPNCVFKNLRFKDENDLSKIDRIEMCVGKLRFDIVYSELYKTIQSVYEMDTIPLYMFKIGMPQLVTHEYEIILHKKDEFKNEKIIMLIDVYYNSENLGINDDSENKKFVEFLSYQSQVIGFTKNEKVQINVNHPCYLFISNKRIHNIKLILKYSEDDVVFDLEQDENNVIKLAKHFNVGDFTKYGINFSRIHTAFLTYEKDETDKDDTLSIIAINSNVVRMSNGMSGLAFSK